MNQLNESAVNDSCCATYYVVEPWLPITVAARPKVRTVFGLSNAGIVGRIPFEAWMSLCVYSVFVLFCVYVGALRRADPPSKESCRLCVDYETEKAAKAQQRALEP
jgi:hypothetical protein